MDETSFIELTIAQAAEQIKERAISPTELIETCLQRIEHLNPRLNAFLSVMCDEARKEAQQATQALERGEYWGPLHGIPIGVKDLIDVRGIHTTAGSTFLAENVAQEDADVVRRLRAAGAIIVGKTHLHEYAIGATNVNPHYGPARNPWNLDYSPGGSSGGSGAAVASGMCLAALGTDTGGSVRLPSALCGLTGLRPSQGRISTQGVIPMSWTLDTVGPMAHDAHDVALLLDALDVQSLEPAHCVIQLDEPVEGVRVGVPVDDYFWQESEHRVVDAVRKAVEVLADLGMQVDEVSLPMMSAIRDAVGLISLSDAAAYHRERLASEPERFGADVRARLEWGMKHSSVDYALARQTGREWQCLLRELFRDRVDVIALPTTPVPAHSLAGSDGVSAARELLRFTYPISLSGLPALSMGCGFTEDGFPIGLQLVGSTEARLLNIAHVYQQVTDWHRKRPTLS